MSRRRTPNPVQTAPAAPLPGAPFRLDGHDYILSAIDDPVPGVFRFTKGHGTPKGAVKYKSGMANVADLQWCATAEEYHALVREEATTLIRGRPVMRQLATAVAEELCRYYDAAGCWYLPFRHLPRLETKPPAYTAEQVAEVAKRLVDPLGEE